MNKKIILITIGIFLLVGTVFAGLGFASRSNDEIEINETAKNILDERDLSNPTISQLICDGERCRSCAKKGDYGMGCISISQRYCSEYNETIINDEIDGTCLAYTNYTLSQLEDSESRAYKNRWERIADVIVERENISIEIKLDEGEVNIIDEDLQK